MTKRNNILNRKWEIMTLEEGHEAGQWGHHEDKCTSPLIKLFEKRRAWVFISVVSMECFTPKAFYTSVKSTSEKIVGVASPKTIFCICLTETFLSPSLRTAWENKIILREYIVVNETCIILFFLSDTLSIHVPFGQMPVLENKWQGCGRVRSFIHEAWFGGADTLWRPYIFVMVIKSNTFNAQYSYTCAPCQGLHNRDRIMEDNSLPSWRAARIPLPPTPFFYHETGTETGACTAHALKWKGKWSWN